MTLPCRIHRVSRSVNSPALALLLTVIFIIPHTAVAQDTTTSPFEQAGIGWLPAIPIQITAGMETGYDDNATLTPNAEGSLFVGENVVLTYNRPTEATTFYLQGIGRFDQYFNVSRNDIDANVTMSLTHNFSTRLSFYGSVFAAYQSQPNFRSNVGPENVIADHFYTNDILSLTYHWSTRFSLITSYTFNRVKYTQASIANFQDRTDGTFSEQLQFSLTSRTNLLGEYRFETTDYDVAPIDSTTHFIIAGINHHLTEHLIVDVHAGESFRSLENDGTTASPYFESRVDYTASNHSLSWTSSYQFEAPTAPGVSTTKTWRTGLSLAYDLTSRLSSTTGVYYHHDENEGTGTQDALDFTATLRYTINKHFTLHLDYQHTTLGSSASMPGYSQNRYFGGVTYNY